MAEITDVREWARQKGHDIGERGRIPKAIQDEYDAEINQRADLNGEPSVALPDRGTGEVRPHPFAAATASSATTPGTRPAATTGSTSQPWPHGSAGGSASSGETKPKPSKRRMPWQKAEPDGSSKPAVAHKRVPLEAWAGRAWKGLAYIAGAGATPTSRCLNMQAPVAGIIVDDMIKGTAIDRLAQPFARWGEGGKNIGALVGLPLLVAATERSPGLYQWTRPLMAEAATEWVLIAGPAMRKAKARAAAVAKELAEFEVSDDDIEGMFEHAAENPAIVKLLDAIFAPMMPVKVEPEPAAA